MAPVENNFPPRGPKIVLGRRLLALAVLALLAFPIATEAQTLTGRLDPQYNASSGFYEYGPLDWDVEVAAGARSDEFSLDLYYNKVSAIMLVSLLCPGTDGDFDTHATSVSAEHFISLTTGLFTTFGDCRLVLIGLSSRNEVLSYRMRVAELATRTTPKRETSSFSAGEWDWQSLDPAAFSEDFAKLEAELTRLR